MAGEREYLDGKFGELHEKLNAINVKIERHMVEPCRDIQKHVDDCHRDNFQKNVATFGTIVAIVIALLAFLKAYLFNGGH